jgi:hypothetical protein
VKFVTFARPKVNRNSRLLIAPPQLGLSLTTASFLAVSKICRVQLTGVTTATRWVFGKCGLQRPSNCEICDLEVEIFSAAELDRRRLTGGNPRSDADTVLKCLKVGTGGSPPERGTSAGEQELREGCESADYIGFLVLADFGYHLTTQVSHEAPLAAWSSRNGGDVTKNWPGMEKDTRCYATLNLVTFAPDTL